MRRIQSLGMFDPRSGLSQRLDEAVDYRNRPGRMGSICRGHDDPLGHEQLADDAEALQGRGPSAKVGGVDEYGV